MNSKQSKRSYQAKKKQRSMKYGHLFEEFSFNKIEIDKKTGRPKLTLIQGGKS